MEALGRGLKTPASQHLGELIQKVSLALLNVVYSEEKMFLELG